MLGSTGITHVSYLQNLKEDKRDSRDSTTECGEYKRAWLQAHKKVSEAKAAAMTQKVAAKVLATYLIPGCVGRGVKLGSENSSSGASAGGVWKSVNLRIWKFGIANNITNRNENPFCAKCAHGLD